MERPVQAGYPEGRQIPFQGEDVTRSEKKSNEAGELAAEKSRY